MEPDTAKFLAFMRSYSTIVRARYTLEQDAKGLQLGVCGECGNRSLVLESEQLRSADEEATEIVWCLECGN